MSPGLLRFLMNLGLDFGGYRNGHRHLLRIRHSAYRELRKLPSTWSSSQSPCRIRLLCLVLMVTARARGGIPPEVGMLSRMEIFFMESISTCRFRRIDLLSCAAALTSMLSFAYKVCMEVVRKGGPRTDDELLAEYPVGRLGFKEEGKALGRCGFSLFPTALNRLYCGLLMIGVWKFLSSSRTFDLHKASGAITSYS
ncbi:conserved hypothetical protein [Ricinus communis]|uniref:Uncharacterized protein n=3 Tax=Ricinus communis TaxID=3988 RepID=B9TEQ9_RICCO|nr:conserved hypothetical protein [Ricinus communis]